MQTSSRQMIVDQVLSRERTSDGHMEFSRVRRGVFALSMRSYTRKMKVVVEEGRDIAR
jgi:hypothetical protein